MLRLPMRNQVSQIPVNQALRIFLVKVRLLTDLKLKTHQKTGRLLTLKLAQANFTLENLNGERIKAQAIFNNQNQARLNDATCSS